jgi:signal transduction histidine kinase
LRLSADAGEVRLQVEDHGPGIAAADRAQALRRFGRLDSARTTPGAGLGLTLIEAVARLHGGRFELGDNAPGLIAAIVLPG